MERGLLSSVELASSYDDVIWMYLFQDFSESEADRAAQRVAIRFGISSWPQHFLVDPRNLEVLGSTERTLETFRAAVASAELGDGPIEPSAAALADADRLARQLEGTRDVSLARELLVHDDVVVRFRAVETLADGAPDELVRRADDLLAIEHDQTRYVVCAVLAKIGNEKAAPALERIVADPGSSNNPNVARIRAVQALATCGTGESLSVIAPHAASGVYFNGLTGVSIDAIASIAFRYPLSAESAREILIGAFPSPPSPSPYPAQAERNDRACTSLARRVNAALGKVTGEEVAFPEAYDETSRVRLIERWSSR